MVPNIKSSLTPNGPGTSQVYYTNNNDILPAVSLSNHYIDCLYLGGNYQFDT